MDALVLVGGSGSRMGALTQQRQKAVLKFGMKSLIARVLDSLLATGLIENTYVLTGYRGRDVRQELLLRYKEQLTKRQLSICDFPQVRGTLNRLVAALKLLRHNQTYCVCGIDSLIPLRPLRRFLLFSQQHPDNLCLLISPRLEIAPTHRLVKTGFGPVEEYIKPGHAIDDSTLLGKSLWYSDVGVRFFPAAEARLLASLPVSGEHYIPEYIDSALAEGKMILTCKIADKWRHIACEKDLLCKNPHSNL